MAESSWFENAWKQREEGVYREVFGDSEVPSRIYTLSHHTFEVRFAGQALDPRWLHHGILLFPPTESRRSWAYVSSGLSNAWEADFPEPEGLSGLGCEFVLETPARCEWAILQVQQVVAFQLLLAAGRFEGRPLLDVGDRIPLHASIEPGRDSELTWLVVTSSESELSTPQLSTGSLEFLRLVGISEAEAEFARKEGHNALLELRRSNAAYPVTNSKRPSLVQGAV